MLKNDKNVSIALPKMPPGRSTCDFNDLLVAKGVDAIAKTLENKIDITDSKQLQASILLMQQVSAIQEVNHKVIQKPVEL